MKSRFQTMAFDENSSDFLYDSSLFLDSMLISCEFQGNPCTIKDFYHSYSYEYGNCFTFNSQKPNASTTQHNYTSYATRKATRPGWQYGLRLEMYAGDQLFQQQFVYKTGFRLLVHNQSSVPMVDEEGIDIGVGMQTNVAIKRTFVKQLSAPYSNCIDTIDEATANLNQHLKEMHIQLKRNQKDSLQQTYCLKICEQQYIISECDCYTFDLAFLNLTTLQGSDDVSGCDSVDEVDCYGEAEVNFMNGDEIDHCYASCPQECNYVDYELSTSFAKYPTKSYANGFNETADLFSYFDIYAAELPENYTDESLDNYDYDGPTLELIQSTTAMINVYYQSNSYKVYQQYPQTPALALFSNIAGNFGLFTGASLLSLVELVECLISVLIVLVFYFLSSNTTKRKFKN